MRHLVAAVRVAGADLPETADVAAGAGVLAEADRLVGGDVIVSLVNDVTHPRRGAAVIVLHDCHVADDPDCHAAVGFLVDNLPSQVTVAMAERDRCLSFRSEGPARG
jgi:ATP/maltotriose-dependent transcriptional regulator MalT